MGRPGQMVKQKGLAFVLVLAFILILATAATTFIALSGSEIRMVRRQCDSTKAFYLAEAGVEKALFELSGDEDYTGDDNVVLGEGVYDVAVTTPDPANYPDQRQIDSVGHIPENDPALPEYQARHIRVMVELNENPLFMGAIFGNLSAILTGNAYTDSYDSAEGQYDPDDPGHDGDVGSNGVAPGTIELTGNSQIDGDATIGVDADPDEAIELTGNATITGEQVAAEEEVVLQDVVIPPGLENSGDLFISGNDTVTLLEGTYWYSSIKISGNGKLELTGDTTIYVSGKVEISGNGIATADELPTNLTIYVDSSEDVKFTGNADFYGGIYAPQSEIKVTGNGKVFGSLIGELVRVTGNGGVHYDEALGREGGGGTYDVTPLSWREI